VRTNIISSELWSAVNDESLLENTNSVRLSTKSKPKKRPPTAYSNRRTLRCKWGKWGKPVGNHAYLHKNHLCLLHSRSMLPVQGREDCNGEDQWNWKCHLQTSAEVHQLPLNLIREIDTCIIPLICGLPGTLMSVFHKLAKFPALPRYFMHHQCCQAEADIYILTFFWSSVFSSTFATWATEKSSNAYCG